MKNNNECKDFTIEGNIVIGENVTIYPGTILKNCKIGNNCIIINSVIEDSEIKENCKIGPYAHIRDNSIINNNCKIGHCSEIKNSIIGEDTKVSHLSYIGDANVGKKVNFGAGSVIANYDGIKKNKTIIGNNVMIGCNSVIVAPLKIGNNVYIAAGSTVTNDIKDDTLTIARSRQFDKENYFKKNIM